MFCRILANRESAAKSKERKKRYEMELQKKVELLDYQVTNLTNCITMFEVCVFLSIYYHDSTQQKFSNLIVKLSTV